MCSHPVSRVLCCAPLSERGVVQDWGSKSWRWRVRAFASCGVWCWSQLWQALAGIGTLGIDRHMQAGNEACRLAVALQ